MTREEALKELDQLSRAVKPGPVSEREVPCPEMKTARRILSIVFDTREKARPAVRKHQKNRGSVTTARACAARLMGPGAALTIPRLSRGCLDPFCPAGDRKELPAGSHLASDGDWRCPRLAGFHRDAVQFMAGTIERAVERFDRRALDPVAHISTSRWEPSRLAWVGEIRSRTRTVFF
jgi:hypothetical protein